MPDLAIDRSRATFGALARPVLLRCIAAALGVTAAALLLFGTAPAEAMPISSTPLPLSISIDNGRRVAEAGDKLTYTVTVTNVGAVRIADLVLTQTMPAGFTFFSADRGGSHDGHLVTWPQLTLSAKHDATVHTSITVASTPDTLLRLATVVCVRVTPVGQPVVCASDSDLLPAGGRAQIKAAEVDPTSWAQVLGYRHWWLWAAALSGVAAIIKTLTWRRRRAARA